MVMVIFVNRRQSYLNYLNSIACAIIITTMCNFHFAFHVTHSIRVLSIITLSRNLSTNTYHMMFYL